MELIYCLFGIYFGKKPLQMLITSKKRHICLIINLNCLQLNEVFIKIFKYENC